MSQIEVPDWVAAVALEACGEHFTGSDADMKRAITAALGALLKPIQPFGDATLYTLRQEKPE